MPLPPRGGVQDRPGQLEPRDHPDRPRHRRQRLHRAAGRRQRREDHRQGGRGRSRLRNGRTDRSEHLLRARRLRRAEEARGRARGNAAGCHRHVRGQGAVQGDHGAHRRARPRLQERQLHRGGQGGCQDHRTLPRPHQTRIHPRRNRRRHRLQRGGAGGHLRPRTRLLQDPSGPHRGERPRMEGVRIRGHEGCRGQLVSTQGRA